MKETVEAILKLYGTYLLDKTMPCRYKANSYTITITDQLEWVPVTLFIKKLIV